MKGLGVIEHVSDLFHPKGQVFGVSHSSIPSSYWWSYTLGERAWYQL